MRKKLSGDRDKSVCGGTKNFVYGGDRPCWGEGGLPHQTALDEVNTLRSGKARAERVKK